MGQHSVLAARNLCPQNDILLNRLTEGLYKAAIRPEQLFVREQSCWALLWYEAYGRNVVLHGLAAAQKDPQGLAPQFPLKRAQLRTLVSGYNYGRLQLFDYILCFIL